MKFITLKQFIDKSKEIESGSTQTKLIRGGTLLLKSHIEIDLRGKHDDDWYTIKSRKTEQDAEFFMHSKNSYKTLLKIVEEQNKFIQKISDSKTEKLLIKINKMVQEIQ